MIQRKVNGHMLADRSRQAREVSYWGLSWPIGLEMFLLLLMGNSDIFMLSFLSDQAVAAVGLANQYVMLSLLVLRVVTVGTQVLLAHYIGARQWQDSSRIVANSIMLNLAAGILLSIVLVVFRQPLLMMLHIDAKLLADAKTYLAVVGGFLFVQSLVTGMSGIMQTYGYAKEAMLVSLGMNLLNVVCNALLIFGLGPIDAMGVTGAAIATTLSRLAALAVFVYLIMRLVPFQVHWRSMFFMRSSDFHNMMKVGVPAAVETLTYNIVQTIFLSYISIMGTEAVAARQYVLNITMFISLFSAALSAANAILVGRYAGAGQYERAYRQTRRSVFWSILLVTVMSGVVYIFRFELIGIFSLEPQVLQWGAGLLFWNIFLEIGRAVNGNVVSALRSVGDANITVWMGFVSMIGISLPLGYGMTVVGGFGLAGVWIATAIDEWVRGFTLLRRWNHGKWRYKPLLNISRGRISGEMTDREINLRHST